MNTEFLVEAINNSDKNRMQKNILLGFVQRSTEHAKKYNEDMDICQELERSFNKVSEIVVSTPEVKIWLVCSKESDDWSTKYPYRAAFFKDDKWTKCSTVCQSLDTAMLIYLEKKHNGDNSQFCTFAMKMLGIKTEE